MVALLSKEKACIFCEKHLFYESKVHGMMPPSVIIANAKEMITK